MMMMMMMMIIIIIIIIIPRTRQSNWLIFTIRNFLSVNIPMPHLSRGNNYWHHSSTESKLRVTTNVRKKKCRSTGPTQLPPLLLPLPRSPPTHTHTHTHTHTQPLYLITAGLQRSYKLKCTAGSRLYHSVSTVLYGPLNLCLSYAITYFKGST